MEEEEIQKEQESKESDILLNKGHKFEITTIFGIVLKLEMKPSKLGTLDYLSAEYAKIGFDKNLFAVDSLNETRVMVGRNAKRCAKIIAIASLNDPIKLFLFGRFLKWALFWALDSDRLYELVVKWESLTNLRNFIYSIQFLSMTPRTMSPNRIEKVKEG
jgi:hypothetical protein